MTTSIVVNQVGVNRQNHHVENVPNTAYQMKLFGDSNPLVIDVLLNSLGQENIDVILVSAHLHKVDILIHKLSLSFIINNHVNTNCWE